MELYKTINDRFIEDCNRIQTELKRAQINKMQAISYMAGRIAHDFNNIISVISGYTGLIKKRLPSDNRNVSFIEHIIEAGKQASLMTEKLSFLVKDDTPIIETVDIHCAIKNTISILTSTFGKDIAIISHLNVQHPVTSGEKAFLQNIFLYIGTNACEACQAKNGKISFSTNRTYLDSSHLLCRSFSIEAKDYICITINDNGRGMSKETFSRIFEPFFSTKPKDKRTGLGLAHVWKYIETYKGAINVTSDPDIGTTFYLYLPYFNESENSATHSPSQLHTIPSLTETNDVKSIKKILIVDDEPSVREIYSDILSDNGYEVYSADNGDSALEFITKMESSIDLVLLDMVMPKMNGTETFKALRSIYPDIKIVFMSGIVNYDELSLLLEEPSTLFFQKPCDDKKLIEHIQMILSENTA